MDASFELIASVAIDGGFAYFIFIPGSPL